ncbi:uncharacterized protein LOC123319955 [Coccinella septempunctata]|uniref:uncharacterized protein LOC123319955 n=1 Tax=Coccinella septempunctata TaxID=41139 RepID=UPI001D06D78D|nr:uncharacterized protein LOC123319955 [Coccinella septempunctata]
MSSSRSDLLATCLRIAEAEEYIDVVEKHGIDTFSLKLLNRDDLEVLGLTDKLKQDIFLENIATLQIPSEEVKSTDIDQEYVKLVLYLISAHLQKHLASLSCAVMRKDVVVNDIELTPSIKCLEQCIETLQEQCRRCRKSVRKPEKQWRKYIVCSVVMGSFLIGSLVIFVRIK